jgi:beta-phosphoglucomutase-like phosphatase (HAD superfamily)
VIEAVLFALDDVLTDTASPRVAAWKNVFDEVFAQHPAATPFAGPDFPRYQDDLRWPERLQAVLASRGIQLAPGKPGDALHRETLAALSRREQEYYLKLVHDRGTQAFGSSIALIRALRRQGIATAAVTGSEHCAQVLDAPGLTQLFDVQVYGTDAARLGLPRKPDPAMHLEAAMEQVFERMVDHTRAGFNVPRLRTIFGAKRRRFGTVARDKMRRV